MEDPRSSGPLIAAILAAPDDDAPRLVYADWLMERGDPRGELIALQCRPALFEGDVFERAWRLEHAHGAAWQQPIRALAREPGPLHFTRGFIERIQLDAADWIRHSEALCALTPLREIELRKVEVLAAALAAPGMQRIRSLEVRGQKLDGARLGDLARVPPLPQLESLALLECGLAGSAVHALAELRAAPRALYLDRNPAAGGALSELLQSPFAARLERLSTEYVSLRPHDVTAIARLAALRVLSVDHSELAGPAVAQIARAVPLAELSAAATRDVDDTTLEALGHHGSLHVLRMPRSALRITPPAMRALLAALPELRTLDLRDCGLRAAEYPMLKRRFPGACGSF